MISIKPGVKLENLSAQMLLATMIVDEQCKISGIDCVITSGSDEHDDGLHPKGRALDYRTRELAPVGRKYFSAEIRAQLGDNYDVVLETDHLHVEYDPK